MAYGSDRASAEHMGTSARPLTSFPTTFMRLWSMPHVIKPPCSNHVRVAATLVLSYALVAGSNVA